jgi:GT2 family glycosyltransferase
MPSNKTHQKVYECKVSVIIPVKNVGDKLAHCLDAIYSQTFSPFEVIVVDGNSTDDTVKIAKKYSATVLYENYGTRAGANQVGIKNAKGEYIAFTDADCIPEADWIEKLLIGMERGIVGVGGCVKNIGETVWEKSINLTQNTFLGAANSVQGRIFGQRKYVSSISGCNSLYRKCDLLKVGGFDTNLTTAEDTDLNRKLLAYGKLLYVPDAVVIHNHGRGLMDFANRMRQYGYGRAKSFLFDLQAIPPLLALIAIITLLINFNIFIYMITCYIILIAIYTVVLFLFNPKAIYLFTIPVVYLIEHVFYAIGFWIGISSKIMEKVN